MCVLLRQLHCSLLQVLSGRSDIQTAACVFKAIQAVAQHTSSRSPGVMTSMAAGMFLLALCIQRHSCWSCVCTCNGPPYNRPTLAPPCVCYAGTHTWSITAACTTGMLSGPCSVTSCGSTSCPASRDCAWYVDPTSFMLLCYSEQKHSGCCCLDSSESVASFTPALSFHHYLACISHLQ